MIRINDKLSIPEHEIRFTAARASGPGGQHVNTTDSKVILHFDVDGSPSLTELQKVLVKGKLGRRIDKRGVLTVSSMTFRSQKPNRDSALDRFVELMRWALTPVTPRRKTRTPMRAVRKRLDGKRHTSRRKQQRKQPGSGDDW